MVVGEFGPICVAIWRDEVDLPRFQKQAEGVAAIAAKYPGKGAFVCVVEPTCSPPNEELRLKSITLVNRHDGELACMAGVIEGAGFEAAIARSVLSGMALLFRSTSPRAYFSNVRAAGIWVGQHIEVDAESSIRTVEEWRASLPPALEPTS